MPFFLSWSHLIILNWDRTHLCILSPTQEIEHNAWTNTRTGVIVTFCFGAWGEKTLNLLWSNKLISWSALQQEMDSVNRFVFHACFLLTHFLFFSLVKKLFMLSIYSLIPLFLADKDLSFFFIFHAIYIITNSSQSFKKSRAPWNSWRTPSLMHFHCGN